MLSKLFRPSYFGFRQLNKGSFNSVLFNTQKSILFKNSTRLISTDNENKFFSDMFDNIPDYPDTNNENLLLNAIGEPTFTSIGLNNYTPPGLVQFILENVHVHLGLPWWACIATTAILIKTVMIPVVLNQRRAIVKSQNTVTKRMSFMNEAVKAKKSGNVLLMIQKIREYERYVNEDKFNMLSLYYPIFIQGPVFISVFLALKGMVNVPVASLATGGLWWFNDLTVTDPYYLLPLATAASVILMFELGVKMPTIQGINMKHVFRCLGPLTFLATCQFPATLVLYWSCSNLYTLIFSQVMQSPRVQEVLNIPKVEKVEGLENMQQHTMKETMEVFRAMHEIALRDNLGEHRFERKEQQEILDRGLAAAANRLKEKEKLKQQDSAIHIKGEFVEPEKQQKKM